MIIQTVSNSIRTATTLGGVNTKQFAQISAEDLSFILIRKREIAVFPLQLLWNLEIRQSNRCSTDLSRNTFYAHYQDIYAVLEELEDDFLSEMNRCLDEAVHNREFFDPLPLLRKFQHFVEDSVETNRLLLANQNAAAFCEKIKRVFIKRVMENLPTTGVKDREGFLIFLECVAGGFVSLYQKSLNKESTLTLDEITSEISQIYTWGLKKYM